MFHILGYDTFSKGLHIYFSRYAWKNTTLPDFVGALCEAWEASGNKSMGETFKLADWCDTWLNSSGVNIIEPVMSHDADGNLTRLVLKQTMGLRGKNRLRQHKLDVCIYNAEGEQHIVKDVCVNASEETEVYVPEGMKAKAVWANHNMFAYCKVRFD